MQSRYEFEQQLRDKINATFNTPVDLSLASQAQFYFDALWTGVLGLNKTLGMIIGLWLLHGPCRCTKVLGQALECWLYM